MPTWKYLGTTPEGIPFIIKGTNIWKVKWESLRWQVELQNPNFLSQVIRLNVYDAALNGETVRFSAGEQSANVWVFYLLE
jgi:hypothetical protein